MSDELVTMVRGEAGSLKNVLIKHGFLRSAKGYWTLSPALNAAGCSALEDEIRKAGAGRGIEVRNIKKEWA